MKENRLNIFDKLASGEWNAWTAIAHRIDDDNSKSQWDRGIYAEAEVVFSSIEKSVQAEDIKEMLGFFLWQFQTFRQLNHDIDSLLYGGIQGKHKD